MDQHGAYAILKLEDAILSVIGLGLLNGPLEEAVGGYLGFADARGGNIRPRIHDGGLEGAGEPEGIG